MTYCTFSISQHPSSSFDSLVPVHHGRGNSDDNPLGRAVKSAPNGTDGAERRIARMARLSSELKIATYDALRPADYGSDMCHRTL